ncbi:hypothetical protein [Streptomyces sp. R35]|uniref:Uncharacterized protein n=1 Tax=Streptomyces sp. R35 TaxID=3238630 RepID=A0AB39SL64_9ACTN
MTFIDPSAGAIGATLPQLRDWSAVWDTYDPSIHGTRPMPRFYLAARHENWWGSSLPFTALLDLAKDHGIPVAWATPTETLRRLAVAGAEHADKLAVLTGDEAAIRDLCRQKLSECPDEWLSGEVAAGEKAVAAWADGHREAAACLAVTGVEQMLHNLTRTKGGRGGHNRLLMAGKKEPNPYLPRNQSVLAPLSTLYTQYYPDRNDPIPDNLSRHAVVHHLPLSHLSPGHCIIAVMLLVSIIRELQERYDDIRDDLLMQSEDWEAVL